MMREAMLPDRSSRPQPRPEDVLAVLSHDSRDGLCTVDANGSLLFINPMAEYLLGWKTDDLQDKHFHDVVHGAHGDACPLQDVLRFGRRVTVEADRFARCDGTTLAVSYTASPVLTDGQVMGAVITFWDRTVSEGVKEQLREREAQYRSIFEATTDGMVIVDMDGLIVEANPAFCRMHGYTYDELLGQPFITLVHPDSQHLFSESVQTIQAQGHWQGRAVNVRKDGTLLHLDASGTAFVYRGAPHLLGVGRDITERVQAEEQLREKEAQYRGIFEATIDGLVIIDLSGVIVEANPAYCAMFGYSYDELIGLPYSVLVPPDQHDAIAQGVAMVLAGHPVQGRTVCLRKDGTSFHAEGHATGFTYRGKSHMLAVQRDVTERVQAYELLEQRVEERTRELSTLLEVSHNVASTLELEPLLGLILDQLKTLVDYTAVAVLMVEEEYLRVLDYRGPLPRERLRGLQLPAAHAPGYQAVLQQGGPVIVDDLQGTDALAQAFQVLPAHLRATLADARSLLIVPLILKDQIIGVVRLDHREPHAYTERHAGLAHAIANQAAVAIENARLYARAQEVAALEERQRLARELHDSVTQALYGVTMYAEAAATLLAGGDQQTATAYLREVRNTAQEALQEMRLLIFELRPPILAQEGLVAALQARLAAVEGRIAGLTATFDVQGDLHLPAPLEEALYGIAQETLNNVFKHAQAHTVTLTLWQEGQVVRLEIADDGTGFNPAAVQGRGGLGLGGMAERAAQVGGRLMVDTTPGQGTRVRVEVEL